MIISSCRFLIFRGLKTKPNRHWNSKNAFIKDEAMHKIKTKLQKDRDQIQGTDLATTITSSFHDRGLEPNAAVYSFVIKTLCQRSLFTQLPPVLNQLENMEKFEPSESIFVDLMKNFGASNMLKEAVDVFFRIPRFRCTHSMDSLNTLLLVLSKSKDGINMIEYVLKQTPKLNIRLDTTSFWIMINTLCKLGKVHSAVQLLNEMPVHECVPDYRIYSLILSSLCQQNPNPDVLFDFIERMRYSEVLPSCVDYGNVIKALINRGEVEKAYTIFTQMRSEGTKPDIVAYKSLLTGFISICNYTKTEELFDGMLLSGLVPDLVTYNTYVDGLCKQSEFEQAKLILISMEKLSCNPSVDTYNILIARYCNAGQIREARESMNEMYRKGIEWNRHTYVILIDGFLRNGDVVDADVIIHDMLKTGFVLKNFSFESMIHGLCKIAVKN